MTGAQPDTIEIHQGHRLVVFRSPVEWIVLIARGEECPVRLVSDPVREAAIRQAKDEIDNGGLADLRRSDRHPL
jgi:hypothetical protein